MITVSLYTLHIMLASFHTFQKEERAHNTSTQMDISYIPAILNGFTQSNFLSYRFSVIRKLKMDATCWGYALTRGERATTTCPRSGPNDSTSTL